MIARAVKPVVIILNGVGSVGKTSTARALQALSARPFVHVSMDTFIGMMPARLFGHSDGMIFETVLEGGVPSVVVQTGPVLMRLLRGMRHAVAALAAQGSDVVVDDVMMSTSEAAEYRAVLAPFRLHMVGLFAPLNVLEERERARGDREIGLARRQFASVHSGQAYDLEIDTSVLAPDECARVICDAFGY